MSQWKSISVENDIHDLIKQAQQRVAQSMNVRRVSISDALRIILKNHLATTENSK